MKRIKRQSLLSKKARKGFRGYPVATIAFYGPTADSATKVAVGIVPSEGTEAEIVERWWSESEDLRYSTSIAKEILEFIRMHGARSVVLADGILGCPHEEGQDYPEGESCPQCPYWAGRDRWTGRVLH